MSATDVLALEGMGFRFRLDGGRVTRRCYGTPPPEAAALLARVTREDVLRLLHDRAAGFTPVCAPGWPENAPETAREGPPGGEAEKMPPEGTEAPAGLPGGPVRMPVRASPADELVERFGSPVTAAAVAEDEGASACRLWLVIYDACNALWTAGARAAALEAWDRLEKLDRDARMNGRMRRKEHEG